MCCCVVHVLKNLSQFSFEMFLGDHQHHGVFGLVAEGFPDDVDSVLMGDSLQGDTVHRHQLKPSLWTQGGKIY